jgi:hypothetical protein
MKVEFPESPAGIHPPTAALTRILRFNAFENPLSGQPYSEAFIMGVGGGLDTGCILYQFKHLPHPMLMLGFRNQWNNTRDFLNKVSDRLQLDVSFIEYETDKEAQVGLEEFLAQGKQPIAWVDKAYLPYQMVPESLKGFLDYQVAVYDRDGRLWRLYLDDLSLQPIEIREKAFTTARGSLKQNNFLLMVIEKGTTPSTRELRKDILAGIRDCAEKITRPIMTIGHCNLETWSQKLADPNDRQGWPQVFKDQKGLYPVLRTVYESIKLDGTEGFALRKLYADFLHEAASYLGNPELNASAGQYLQLANRWSNLAETTLSSDIPAFKEIKTLLNDRYQAYKEGDFKAVEKAHREITRLEKKIETDFPMNAPKTHQLFENLAGQVKLLAELEMSAARRLQDVTHH